MDMLERGSQMPDSNQRHEHQAAVLDSFGAVAGPCIKKLPMHTERHLIVTDDVTRGRLQQQGGDLLALDVTDSLKLDQLEDRNETHR